MASKAVAQELNNYINFRVKRHKSEKSRSSRVSWVQSVRFPAVCWAIAKGPLDPIRQTEGTESSARPPEDQTGRRQDETHCNRLMGTNHGLLQIEQSRKIYYVLYLLDALEHSVIKRRQCE